MIVIDYDKVMEYSQDEFPGDCGDGQALFVFCRPKDVTVLHGVFNLDESTVLDCMDIDESVRFTAFDGYDFASLVYPEEEQGRIVFSELNLYLSRRYMVLVMPDHGSAKLYELEEKMLMSARSCLNGSRSGADASECFNQLCFVFFNTLISHFSDMLETLEDRMQALSDEMTHKIHDNHFEDINTLRGAAYSVKKVLRAFSYMGIQMLCNENDVLSKKKMFLFRSLDTRFRKLYDFAENVYVLSTELLRTYDSKVSQRTNDIVNKLTFVTLFFGPLTVITGIYGMNFRNMPELNASWGYPSALILMALISAVIYMIMKKKKWL